MKDKKKLFIIIGGFVLLLLVLAMLMSFSGTTLNNLVSPNTASSVSAEKSGSGQKLIVHNDGRVEVHKDGKIFTDYWGSGKVNAFLAYYSNQYGDSPTATYSEDELIDAIVDETSGGAEDEIPGTDIEDIFSTPTPNPTGNQGGPGGGSPTPGATSSPEDEPWCLYWRLSYCVILYTPKPTPTGGGTPSPEEGILPPDCGQNTQTGRTVIGKELCVPTPTP